MASTSTEPNKIQSHHLRIDNVLSSQPELGPKIPDGGYGWLIFAASSFFQIIIPSLSVGYGTIVMFTLLENGISTNLKLWDISIIYAPLFFICIWTLTEPWCKKIAIDSAWPRLVVVAATCLTSAGLLVLWLAINKRKIVILYVAAGSLSGFGASLLLTQVDVIVSQYFHLRLQTVRTLLNAFTATGFILTPIILGHGILKIGILRCITWYQAIILQGLVIGIAFKKPEYLKLHRSRYNLLKGIADEEEDIFTKSTTELQSTRTSLQNDLKSVSVTESDTKSNPQPQSLQEELSQAGWEKFNEDSNTTTNKHTKLNVAFAVEFNNTSSKVNHIEENIDIPQPLFTDSYLNNNVSYSYESSPTEVDNPVVFMPIVEPPRRKWTPDLNCFKQPTFYKTLFFVITLKYSIFTFWTLFPSQLYLKIDHLKVHHAAILVGCVGIMGLIFSVATTCIKINKNIRIAMVSIFCWTGAAGSLIFSDSRTEAFTVIAAALINLNINSLQILAAPLMKFNTPCEQSSGHLFISTITAICLILLLGIGTSYQNCFRLLAVLQLLAGFLHFTNVIYKKIRTYKYTSYH